MHSMDQINHYVKKKEVYRIELSKITMVWCVEDEVFIANSQEDKKKEIHVFHKLIKKIYWFPRKNKMHSYTNKG